MKTCIFYTLAYNAEKTIERTIKSILAQTEQNWVWYLIDNGATDSTGKIIRDYAGRDSRIIPLANKQNNVWEPGIGWQELMWQHDESDCMCFIDADDEYKPEFAEKMLWFIENNALEVAACGYDQIDAASGRLQILRAVNADLILDTPALFGAAFPIYHRFMRTMWCKLYKISVLRRLDPSRTPLVFYGWDTLFASENFRTADRVGILAESLHKYYVNKKSASYNWNADRIAADRILDDMTRAFLMDKCGEVSPRNDDFLQEIYLAAVRDTMEVLLNSQIPAMQKYKGLADIFMSDHTQRMIDWPGHADDKKRLFGTIADWVLGQEECWEPEGAETAADILMGMYPELKQSVSREALTCLLSAGGPDIDAKLCEALANYPMLRDVGASLARLLTRSVVSVMRGDFTRALDEFISDSQDAEIDDGDAEAYLLLAQNLSAVADNTGAYIFFKKLWISYLLDCSRDEEAGRELDEFEQILPDDEDFAGLRKRLNS